MALFQAIQTVKTRCHSTQILKLVITPAESLGLVLPLGISLAHEFTRERLGFQLIWSIQVS